jgi:hypothetical protein
VRRYNLFLVTPNTISIGLYSGEYAGVLRSVKPLRAAAARTKECLCMEWLSSTH